MFVEGWAPEYGAPFDPDEQMAPAEGTIDPAVERTEWEPLEGADDGVDQVAFKYRNWHTLSTPRLIATAAVLLLIPAATQIPALAALGVVAAVMVALIAFESLTYSELREQVRHVDDLEAGELHAEAS